VNFNSKNVEMMYNMFSNLDSMKNLTVKLDTHNVISMDYMFAFSKSLKSLNLSSFDTRKVKEMNHMFLQCESLEDLDVSSFNTTNVQNFDSMFSDCHSIKVLDLSSFDTTNALSYSNMFYNCENLHRLDISNFHFKLAKLKLNLNSQNPLVIIINKDIEKYIKRQAKDDWMVIVK